MPTKEIKGTRKDNGDGCIRERSDGRWEAIIQIGITETGKAKNKHLYAKTEREVKKKLKEYKKEMARGVNVIVKLTLNEYLDRYLKNYKYNSIKDSSYDRLESIFINHVRPTIGFMQMGNIGAEDIQKLINERSETYSYSTVKKIHELLNPCFRHAVLIGDLHKNPMLGVVMPKRSQMTVKTKSINIYSDKDIDKIINVINDTFNDKIKMFRYSPIFIFILNTGCRAGEVLALTWDKIDFNKKYVKINQSLSKVKSRGRFETDNKQVSIITNTKTENGDRIIPLNMKAINALKEIQRRNKIMNIESDYVVANKLNEHLELRTFQQAFERIANRAGIENRGVHALRHTFGSKALRSGVDIKVVSELLGHGNINITYNKYIHIIKEQKVQAVKLLEMI